MLCCAALCFLSNLSTSCETKYQVPGTGMSVLCTGIFAFSSVDLSRSSCFLPHANYTRTADQNVTPPTITLHSAGQLALHKQLLALSIAVSAHAALGIINSLFAPNHGPLLSAPFTCFSCILPCANVAGGASRPRSGSPRISYHFIYGST